MVLWALLFFGWIWLSVFSLAQAEGAGCRDRLIGLFCGTAAASVFGLSACAAGLMGALGAEPAWWLGLGLGGALVAVLTGAWARIGLKAPWLGVLGMGLHPVFHLIAVGLLAMLAKKAGLPTGA